MTNPYQPQPGQPDPNTPAWPSTPATYQPGGYAPPPYGQQQPYFPPPQPPKSNKGLIIGLGAGVLVLLLAVGGGAIAFMSQDDSDPETPSVADSADGSTTPTPSEESSEEESTGDDNNGVTARYATDFRAVCEGGSILNAAEYRPGGKAKALVFANTLGRPQNWSHQSVTYSGPLFAKPAAFKEASVVGCLDAIPGSEGKGTRCDVEDRDKKRIRIQYVSSKYKLAFHAAKTGEKIGDGGTVNAPATRCPFLVSYDPVTKKSYAPPDDPAVTAAFEKFLS